MYIIYTIGSLLLCFGSFILARSFQVFLHGNCGKYVYMYIYVYVCIIYSCTHSINICMQSANAIGNSIIANKCKYDGRQVENLMLKVHTSDLCRQQHQSTKPNKHRATQATSFKVSLRTRAFNENTAKTNRNNNNKTLKTCCFDYEAALSLILFLPQTVSHDGSVLKVQGEEQAGRLKVI